MKEIVKGSIWREIFPTKGRVKVIDVYVKKKGVLAGKTLVKACFLDKKEGNSLMSYQEETFKAVFEPLIMIVQ